MKKLGDMTGREIKNYCKDPNNSCDECKFRFKCTGGPSSWDLNLELDINENKFSDKDFKFAKQIDYYLCTMDVKSSKYKIYKFAMDKNEIDLIEKYGHGYYQEVKNIKDLDTPKTK